MKILVLEDEKQLAEFIQKILEHEEHMVTVCPSIEEAMKHSYYDTHDLIILDLMLEGKSGDVLVKDLRSRKNNIPILVLSALSGVHSKVELLSQGADDYLTKPFDAQELLARIKALYRRHLDNGEQHEDFKQFESLTFFYKENRVIREGKVILLTEKECELLLYLIQNKGRTVRIGDILSKVWSSHARYHSNIVQSTVRRLRNKLDRGFSKRILKNIHGIGYILDI